MDIEKEIFKNSTVDFSKLESYGFQKKKDCYILSKIFLGGAFEAQIGVDTKGEVSGKVFDLQAEEEYTAIRFEKSIGQFVSSVREAYKDILKEIKQNCFIESYFSSPQANRIAYYLMKKYGNEPEFLWENVSDSAVFRNAKNGKWYGIMMYVDRSKIDKTSGKVEILDIKVEEEQMPEFLLQKGFYPGYHMNKKNWLTVILDDSISDEEIFSLLDQSYQLVCSEEIWIVPANPKYYDIIGAFKQKDEILWKQSSDVRVGDIVHIYVAVPYSSILYRCLAIEVNIPYEYKNKNISMSKAMKLRLEKSYPQNRISFSKLQELGIKAIRGPRKISKKTSMQLEKL